MVKYEREGRVQLFLCLSSRGVSCVDTEAKQVIGELTEVTV